MSACNTCKHSLIGIRTDATIGFKEFAFFCVYCRNETTNTKMGEFNRFEFTDEQWSGKTIQEKLKTIWEYGLRMSAHECRNFPEHETKHGANKWYSEIE
jgi:hypothetical protein